VSPLHLPFGCSGPSTPPIQTPALPSLPTPTPPSTSTAHPERSGAGANGDHDRALALIRELANKEKWWLAIGAITTRAISNLLLKYLDKTFATYV
jgi:hypothetical protein